MSVHCHACDQPIRAAGPRFCPHCGAPQPDGAAPLDRDRAEHSRIPPDRTRNPCYRLYRGWRWLIFAVFVGCVAVFFGAAGLPLPRNEQTALCWYAALAAMFTGAIVLAGLPGSIAHARAHPHAHVILVCGWIGMFFTGGVLWLIALAWAGLAPLARAAEELRHSR